MLCAQCHANRNYGGLQILSVACYMLFQTDLVINFNIYATQCKSKKYKVFLAQGVGGICINFIKCILRSV